MNKSKNTFLKSKMNKDLDARILPNNEYRDAINVQVNKSEGANVGSLENVLGNSKVADAQVLTGSANLYCIGSIEDEASGIAYLFFTNWSDVQGQKPNSYSPSAKNYILAFNSQDTTGNPLTILVQGGFLNFSQTRPVHGLSIVENLLFWTDNRNQPRCINISLANPNRLATPTHYTNEDQISVAKYNPYKCIELYAESKLTTSATPQYETTMKDVTSKNLPNGGNGSLNASVTTGATSIFVKNFIGDILLDGNIQNPYNTGSSVSYVDALGVVQTIPSLLVETATYDDTGATPTWELTFASGLTFTENLPSNTVIILNVNPYYNPEFAGDPTYLDDKFVRFGYRFKFEDSQYSLFSTFTQAAFIPKQDGYFMYVNTPNLKEVNNESETLRSTIVSFVENKVDDIKLRIPLPYANYSMLNSLKVTAIDILYKESDQLPIKVVDTVDSTTLYNSSGIANVKTTTSASVNVNVDGILGGIQVGSYVTGFGITTNVTVVSYTPDNPSVLPSTSGRIELSSVQTLIAGVKLTIGEPNYHVYNYQSKKPFKTLPEKDLIRVYDKTPVRALAQEISGNRVIYGNYQNKHTAPEYIDYNVAISPKSDFDLNGGTAAVSGSFPIGSTVINITNPKGDIFVGMVVVSDGVAIGTLITNINGNTITLDTPTIGILVNLQLVILEPGGDTQNSTSKIEYPNSSVKTNRNYQVGVVLSDRYGRQSGVILSNNKELITIGSNTFKGSTIYSPYNDINVDPDTWPGDSIKLIFNNEIATVRNFETFEPGVYNGDATSLSYNPLGWYSYKIVVKQTEQEYYNVYLPGIMASYPNDITLEVGVTSHIVLISDNINKVPRDLTEVGPTQNQFRSSVKLYGRVENSVISITTANDNVGQSNLQYYPGRSNDIAITISTVNDLFDYDPLTPPEPNLFPQFYTLESNPYVARISTASKIGQLANINYTSVSAFIAVSNTTNTLQLYGEVGAVGSIEVGMTVTGPNFPDTVVVSGAGYNPPTLAVTVNTSESSNVAGLFFAGTGLMSVGQIVSGAGVPEGTVVLEIINPSVAGEPNVILNNISPVSSGESIDFTTPGTLIINEQVAVNAGDRIDITSETKPGIQYLAVYETEPVNSLLDIFWESSTTGVIEDVNNIILNENTGGEAAGGVSPFNLNNFLESLRQDPVTSEWPNITTTPFGLVTNFGTVIASPLTLDSITDGFGTNVQTAYTDDNNVIQPVFSFEETGSGSNLYNLKISTGFVNHIWFGTEPERFSFTCLFSATVNGLTSSFEKELNLENVSPHFYYYQPVTMNALGFPTPSNIINVYNVVGNVDDIDIGDNVDGPGYPANLVVSGNGYTPNDVPWAPEFIQPQTTGVSNATTIPLTFTPLGSTVGYLIRDVDSVGTVPEGTYIVSISSGTPGSIVVSQAVTLPANAKIQWRPTPTLEVNQQVAVSDGDSISVYEDPVWDNCPMGPYYPGNTTTEIIATIYGVNGAGFDITDLAPQGNANAWKDLTFTMGDQFNSQNELVDYFEFGNSGVATKNGTGLAAKGEITLLNKGYEDSSMPSDIYTVNMTLGDPGASVSCSAIINTGAKVCLIQQWKLTGFTRNCNANIPIDPFEAKFTLVFLCPENGYAYPFGNGQTGWYVWQGGSQNSGDFPNWDNMLASQGGGSNISIVPTNGLNAQGQSRSQLLGLSGNAYDQYCTGAWSGPFTNIQDVAIGTIGNTFVLPGLLTGLATGDCIGNCLVYSGASAWSWTQTAGSGTATPINPAPSNYVFSINEPT